MEGVPQKIAIVDWLKMVEHHLAYDKWESLEARPGTSTLPTGEWRLQTRSRGRGPNARAQLHGLPAPPGEAVEPAAYRGRAWKGLAAMRKASMKLAERMAYLGTETAFAVSAEAAAHAARTTSSTPSTSAT